MIVRNIKSTDNLSAIAGVYVKSWIETYKDFVPESFLDEITKESWLENVKDNKNFFIMISNKEVIGTAFISEGDDPNDDYGQVESIYLNFENVDQGYGRLLLNAMVKELYERGYPKAFSWVLKENVRARKFYEKNGFKPVGETRNLNLGGSDFIELRYELDMDEAFDFR